MEDDFSTSEIHSIEILHYQNSSQYVFFAMRDGSMISSQLSSQEDKLEFSEVKITKFGKSPVEFISATHSFDSKEVVYLSCEYLWAIRLKVGESQVHEIDISEILFDDHRIVLFFVF
jgi:hypothetical protein